MTLRSQYPHCVLIPAKAGFFMGTHWRDNYPVERRMLLERAEAARHLIRRGADPYLMLWLVIRPTERIEKEQRRAA